MAMDRRSGTLRVAMAGVVLLGCFGWAAAQDIKYNYLSGTDFSKYKTYRWVKVPNVQYPNQILDTQIMQAFDAQLALKGLTKSEDKPRPLRDLSSGRQPGETMELLQYRW